MVTAPPLLLVISIPSSLVLGLVRGLNDTDEQSGSVGPEGVGVKDGVKVGVRLGVSVCEGAALGATVFVGGRVRVGVNVAGPLDGVHEGSTKPVLDGDTVADGVCVRVWVDIIVGVDVIPLCICP